MRQRKNKDGGAKFRGSRERTKWRRSTRHREHNAPCPLPLGRRGGRRGEAQEERMILDSVPEKSLANREGRIEIAISRPTGAIEGF